MAIAGRVAIVPKGDWSANATYKRLDAVTYNNTLYFAKKNVPAGTVTSNTEYWTKSIVGSAVTADDALSPTSTNPVQNKVVTSNLTDLKKETTVNLLNPTLQTTTLNGVTCTNNGDGTYTLNGTATKLIDLDLTTSLTIENGKEYLMCFPSPSSSVKIYLMNGQSQTEAYGSNPTQFKYIDKTNSNKAVHLVINSGYVCNNLIVKPMITTNLSATYDDFVPYTGDTGKLNGDVAELKKTINGALPAANVVNNQTTTEEGFALDARQANPNVKGSLGAQIKAINDMLNTKKIPSFAIENIFTGNPFCVVSGITGLASFSGTKWEPDNGGYHVEDIKYPAGGQVNVTVNFTLTAHSIVIIDVNTLNSEKIEVRGSCISYNFTDSPKNDNISIQFAGRNENTTTSTIRYMPLVIHLA